LDADFALLSDVMTHRLIQPVPALLKQFLLFSAWSWGEPRKYLLRQPMFQKNQFTAPAHCCFCCAAVDTSCFYYVFYWFLLLLYWRYSRTRAMFLKSFKNNELHISGVKFRQKKAGVLLRKAPAFVTACDLGNVTLSRNGDCSVTVTGRGNSP
jgi:hypothetical protein